METEAQKQMIKHDIEHLYLPGFTTLKALCETYGISRSKISDYEKEVVDAMTRKGKDKKYFPEKKNIFLGQLPTGQQFFLKEYEDTKFAYLTYVFIKTANGNKVLVKNPSGKEELMRNDTKVILKDTPKDSGPDGSPHTFLGLGFKKHPQKGNGKKDVNDDHSSQQS